MLPQKISLDVVTPRGRVLSEEVDEVVLPGAEGYLGVRPGHTPLLLSLGIGVLSWKVGGQEYRAAVARGFAEVLPAGVSVLAEIAELGDQVDDVRAEAALERANKWLARMNDPDLNIDRAQESLRRAEARLQARRPPRA